MSPHPNRHSAVAAAGAAAGFTLIELLVVIGILGLLVVAFLPDLIGARQGANITDARARLQHLNTGIQAFVRKHGWMPPDNLVHPDPESKLKLRSDNGLNTGIESLVVFLSQERGGIDLSENNAWLSNHDGDDNGAPIPLLGRSQRMEVSDPWGTPLAYFSAVGTGFDKPQRIMAGDEAGGELNVRAWQDAEGGYLGGRKFQLISAGPDLQFNTDDDITWPER